MATARADLDKYIQKIEEDEILKSQPCINMMAVFLKELRNELKKLEAKMQDQKNIIKSKNEKIEELKISIGELQQQEIESEGN